MYRVIVYVSVEVGTQSFEFLEEREDDALHRAQEVAQIGFWNETPPNEVLIPPSRIECVRVLSPGDRIDL